MKKAGDVSPQLTSSFNHLAYKRTADRWRVAPLQSSFPCHWYANFIKWFFFLQIFTIDIFYWFDRLNKKLPSNAGREQTQMMKKNIKYYAST